MHMLVSMYYCIYMFSYGPYGPEIKHYYYYYYIYIYIYIYIHDVCLNIYYMTCTNLSKLSVCR